MDSEALSRVEYDPGRRVLFLRFADGDWYAYLGVGRDVHEALMAAPSKGRFFQDRVRDRYPYVALAGAADDV